MIRRKGSRTIVVANRQFRWTVRQKPTYAQAIAITRLNLAVVLADGGGSRLIVRINSAHPSNLLGQPSAGVTPAQVAAYIANALDAGWRPDLPDPVFELEA